MKELVFLLVFLVFILGVLFFDLLVVGRKAHVVSFREAGIWSAVWITLAFLFFVFLRFRGEFIHGVHGPEDFDHLKSIVKVYYPDLKIAELEFTQVLEIFRHNLSLSYLSGYLIEETLSLDNLFVILLVLTSFRIPLSQYKKILFWGILGALVMRFAFIFIGAALIKRFDWVLYIFGAFLVFTGIRILIKRESKDSPDMKQHRIVRFLKKILPVTDDNQSGRFLTRNEGILLITPMLLSLILVEFSDVIFAIDSIPAIFSVTRDPFVVFYSNIFAIIGLRSLFFFLANLVGKFRFLKTGIAVLLNFIGIKLLLHHWFETIGFRPEYSLYVIGLVIGLSIIFSMKLFIKI